jgi:hypothetical protein
MIRTFTNPEGFGDKTDHLEIDEDGIGWLVKKNGSRSEYPASYINAFVEGGRWIETTPKKPATLLKFRYKENDGKAFAIHNDELAYGEILENDTVNFVDLAGQDTGSYGWTVSEIRHELACGDYVEVRETPEQSEGYWYREARLAREQVDELEEQKSKLHEIISEQEQEKRNLVRHNEELTEQLAHKSGYVDLVTRIRELENHNAELLLGLDVWRNAAVRFFSNGVMEASNALRNKR